MNSFILIGSEESRNTYIEEFAKQKNIAKFDIHTFEPSESSFGIQDIREIQKIAFLKPIQSQEKILLLKKAETLTGEAQNALLKLLEEPPKSTYLFLAAINDASFLATIMSRCKLIVLQQEKKEIGEQRKEELANNIHIIEQGSVTQKLALAESLSQDKEKLSAWLEDCILQLRENMLEEPMNKNWTTLLTHLQKARMLFQTTNVSPRMILEHTFLTL